MTTLAAVVQATEPPRIQVTATDVTPGEGTVTLYRIADGIQEPVRGLVAEPNDQTTWVVNDSEAPFGVPVHYLFVITFATGTTEQTQSNTVTITTALPWVSNPITGQGVAVTIQGWAELTRVARQTVVPVAGRPAPIIVSDVRQAPASTLTLLTLTRDQLGALRQLLATGDVLQVRAVCGAVEGAYVAVGDVTEARVKPDSRKLDPRPAGSDWRRLVALACQEVDRPAPAIPAAGDTLADLAVYVRTTLEDIYLTWPEPQTLLDIARTSLVSA